MTLRRLGFAVTNDAGFATKESSSSFSSDGLAVGGGLSYGKGNWKLGFDYAIPGSLRSQDPPRPLPDKLALKLDGARSLQPGTAAWKGFGG